MSVNKVPSLKCNNGTSIPIVGLGTWKSKPGEIAQAVVDAIDLGYRHLDCAYIYFNEKEVGEGIRRKIEDSTIKREDVFVTSKLWNIFHEPKEVLPALKATLSNLGLEYLDLYLCHWPMGFANIGADPPDPLPTNPDGSRKFSDVDYLDTWKAMEEAVSLGLTKSIGLSNFNSQQIQRVLDNCSIKPVANQFECHPYLNQKKLIQFCKSKGLVVTAYCPLGAPDRPWAQPGEPILLDDPKLLPLAKKYNKTPAQILLKYLVQQDVSVIPKSVTKSRIEKNIQLFDFELSPEDMAAIDNFSASKRYYSETGTEHHKYYPFEAEF